MLFFPNKYFSSKYNFIGYKVKGKEEFTKFEISGQISFFESQEDNNEIGFLKTNLNIKTFFASFSTNICYFFVFQSLKMNILIPEDFGIFKQRFNISLFDNLKLNLSFAIFFGLLFGGIFLFGFGGYKNEKCSIFLSVCSIISFFSLLIIDLSYNISIFYIGIFMFFLFLHHC